MTKVIVFTDLHVGQSEAAADPIERLQHGLRHVGEHNPDADLIVLCGDLTHDGDIESYVALRYVLAAAPKPVQLLMGNHDHRANALAVFPETPVMHSGHIQSVIDTADARLIFLDTLQAPPYSYPFSHIGVLCPDRLAWLDDRLAEVSKPCVIFMHHPPHDTGMVAMDSIKLGNGTEFYDLLERHNTVCHIVAGHIHRTISGSHRGIPFSIFKSIVGQMPMLFDVMDFHMETNEPAAYGILNIGPLGVIVHTEDYQLTDLAALRAQSLGKPGNR